MEGIAGLNVVRDNPRGPNLEQAASGGFAEIAGLLGNNDGLTSATEVNQLSGQLSSLIAQSGGKLDINKMKSPELREAARAADLNASNFFGADGILTQGELEKMTRDTLKNAVGSDQNSLDAQN